MIRVIESAPKQGIDGTREEIEIAREYLRNGEIQTLDDVRRLKRELNKNYNYERDFNRNNVLTGLAMKPYCDGVNVDVEKYIEDEEKSLERELKSAEETERIRNELNTELKSLRTYEDVKELWDKSYNNPYHRFDWRLKRIRKNNNVMNGIPEVHPRFPDKVTYICDGDDRVRVCKISDLWKNVFIG